MIQIFLEGRKWVQFDPICILVHLALLNDAKTLVRCWTGNLMQPHAVWCLVEGPEVCVTHHCYYLLWRSKNGHCVYVIAECPFEIISVRYSRSIRDERNSTDTRQPRRKASQKWIQHAKRKRVSTKMPATTSQS